MPKLHPAQFQFVVNARVKKGSRPTRQEVRLAVEHWIEGTEGEHPNWKIHVIIWNGGNKRQVTELDNSPRGEVLRSVLRRGLQGARFRVNTMGRKGV